MMLGMRATLEIEELLRRMDKYLPDINPTEILANNARGSLTLEQLNDLTKHNAAEVISGRLLEEAVELHVESGGSATSAMAHVMDAITNESFKVLKAKGKSGGPNQDAYPSVIENKYSRDDVVSEIADVLFLLIMNGKVSEVDFSEVFRALVAKVEKLEKAEAEGKLTRTSKGTFYINKDK